MISKLNRTHKATIKAISAHLGRSIRDERERRGMLQKDACALLEVSLPTYRSLEAGQPTVSLGLLISALVVFEISDALLDVQAKAE